MKHSARYSKIKIEIKHKIEEYRPSYIKHTARYSKNKIEKKHKIEE